MAISQSLILPNLRRCSALGALGLLFLAGCGDDGGDVSAGDMARDLADAIRSNRQGVLTDVTCVPRGDNIFRCVGRFTPSLASMQEEIDATGVQGISARQLRRIRTGQLSYEVTVNPDDGSFIYE